MTGLEFMLSTAKAAGRGGGHGLSTYESWQLNRRKDEIREDWRGYLDAQGVDVIVCPVAPWPAHPHGKGTYGGLVSIEDTRARCRG
jgi:Asp-tRNA(Asn)/Glu-tRNA(Gln) amidotransferase A subunit family amidase